MTMKYIGVKINTRFLDTINKFKEECGYSTLSELIREALREKIDRSERKKGDKPR